MRTPSSPDLVPFGHSRSDSLMNENLQAQMNQDVPLRILMAEDNLINQRVGKLILQRAGFAIDLVTDGNEALEAHRKNPYDLILMYCQILVRVASEAGRSIRQLGKPQPVII